MVCTGGEPLLQLDEGLIAALHTENFEIAIETNGTLLPPPGLDWICVSPKANAPQLLTAGDELKLVYPQKGGEPEKYTGQDFAHFFLQPMDSPGSRMPTIPGPQPRIAFPIRNGGCRSRPTNCLGFPKLPAMRSRHGRVLYCRVG